MRDEGKSSSRRDLISERVSEMKSLRDLVLICAAVFLIPLSMPQYAQAMPVPTEHFLLEAGLDEAIEARTNLKNFLLREDVAGALHGHGLSIDEVNARIDTLSDAEVLQVASVIEGMPAAGSTAGAVVGAVVVIFLVLLVTDLLGLTSVFPFTR